MSEVAAYSGLNEVVWVRGPDTVRFLDGLISQDVAALAEGAVAHAFLLAPNGKLRTPHVLWRGADEVGLVAGPGGAEILSHDLSRFKIRVDATIDKDPRNVVTLIGDEVAAVTESLGLNGPEADGWVTGGDHTAGYVPFALGGPRRVVVVGATVEQAVEAGATAGEHDDFEALRIERGEPIVGRDVDESTIPQEMGTVDHAVSFTKGCYLGQELVARIDSRGRVNRNLRGLVIDVDAEPAIGSNLVVEDKIVGELTSLATSGRLGAKVGLAMVRREVNPGDVLELQWEGSSVAAAVAELPLA